jgi:pimeloyl-ACP methyl ester carboxylesterase
MKLDGLQNDADFASCSDGTPRSRYMLCDKYELHYMEWGTERSPTVVMWHGLARTSRDFDILARRLSSAYRVVCPDVIGRGLSQWSSIPDHEYSIAYYGQLAHTFVEQLRADRVVWIGTSMGGAIGMHCAATLLRDRIESLVLNDIGPTLPRTAIERIVGYVGNPPSFDTVTALEEWMRETYGPYGWQSDAGWRAMTESSMRRLSDGRVTLHYDPAIAQQLVQRADDFELWPAYDALRIPVLLLRGAESDLLLPEVADAMTRRGPRAKRVDFVGCGHAPQLNVEEQIREVEQFLGHSRSPCADVGQ